MAKKINKHHVSCGNVTITLTVLAVAKYCDEYVWVCVCLSTGICSEPHARSLPNFLCMMPMAVAQFCSGIIVICYMYFRFCG